MHKNEIIEAVVMSVCQVFRIGDWRKLQNMEYVKGIRMARYATIVLLSERLGCTLVDTHKYFPVFANAQNCSIARGELGTIHDRYLGWCRSKIEEYLRIDRDIEITVRSNAA